MFGTYFKQSLLTLPFIVIIPMVVCVVYIWKIDPYGSIIIGGIDTVEVTDNMWEMETTNEESFLGFSYSNHESFKRVKISMLIAVLCNILFLLIVPCLFGGAVSRKKRAQFYLGFFVNIALSILLPIYFIMAFLLANNTQLFVLIALHLAGFVLPFVLGALFVSPAYSRAFWFCNRRG